MRFADHWGDFRPDIPARGGRCHLTWLLSGVTWGDSKVYCGIVPVTAAIAVLEAELGSLPELISAVKKAKRASTAKEVAAR